MSRPPNPELIENIQVVVSDLVKQKGIDGITLRMISRRLNITATTIYYYYKDKDDLISKIKERGYTELDNCIADNIKPKDSSKNQLKGVVLTFVKWCAENENLASMMFEKLQTNEAPKQKVKNEVYFKTYNRVLEILKKGKDREEFKIDDCELEASISFSLLYGIVTLYFNKRFIDKYNKDIEYLAKKAVDVLFNHYGINK